MTLNQDKKDFIIILLGKIFQVILMILSIRISTILLDPKEMGTIYIFTTTYTFFVFLLISPFGQYINRHTYKWYKNKTILDNLMLYFFYLVFVSSMSIFIGYLLYNFEVITNIELLPFICLLFGFVLFLTLNQTIIPLLNMLHYRLIFTTLTIFTALGIIVLGTLFLSLFGHNAQNWLLAIVFSNIIVVIIGLFVLKKKINENVHSVFVSLKKLTMLKLKEILIFTIPLSFSTLFMWGQNSGYRIIVEKNIGLEFLGFLGVGLAISSQISSTFESIVMQYFHPIYYQQITDATYSDRKKAINILINKILPIYFMLAIFLCVFAKYIVIILADSKYHGAYIFTMFGIWIEFFRMVTNLLGNISQSEMNTKKFMVPYLIGSITTLVLVYISSLTLEYKMYIPISLIIGGFTTMLVMYIFMKKLINFKIYSKLVFVGIITTIPYFSVYFFSFNVDIYTSLLMVVSFGLYFLGTIYFIYKKGLMYGYC